MKVFFQLSDTTPAENAASRGVLGRLLPCGLFTLAFCSVAAVLSLSLRSVTPAPDLAVLSPKIAAFADHPEDYNTVFIGTSRTFYHVVPGQVEASAAVAGCQNLKVLNLGVFGVTGAELDWLLDETLRLGEGHLETVIIEDALPETRNFADATNERTRYFNSPQNISGRLESIGSYPESTAKRVFRLGIFGYGMVFDLSGIGRASEIMFPPAEPVAVNTFDMTQHGFEALGSIETPDIIARRERFLSEPEAFDAALARYGAASDEDVTRRADYLQARLARIEEAGLQAGLFVSPDPMELDRTPRTGEAVRALDAGNLVINMNRPDVYPALFERDLWFDESHVTETGAGLLSDTLGRELCAGLKDIE